MLFLFFPNLIFKKKKSSVIEILYVTVDLFIENCQNKAESYKIKIYNQFFSLKLFYLKIINILIPKLLQTFFLQCRIFQQIA